MNTHEFESPPYLEGYTMPPEWARHEGTWISWPKDPTTFPEDTIEKVEEIYIAMIEALSEGEIVNVLVNDVETEKRVSSLTRSSSNVIFQRIKSVDVWIRDYGPIFVRNKTNVAAIKWIFNAWGNKYDDLLADNETGERVAETSKARIFIPNIVLEGGSIDVNGKGTLLTSKQCLLNKNRNPSLSQEQISDYLRNYLGATNVIWLEEGIRGDDTDGHVDDIARFVKDDTVVCMVENDSHDDDYLALRRNYEILERARDQDGNPLKVVQLEMPKKKVQLADGRLPASYANFYIGNTCLLLPTYSDDNDDKAIHSLRQFFPDRKIVPIECSPLVFGFGSIHCVTQQQPALTRTRPL
jgi:agmatine deiminase